MEVTIASFNTHWGCGTDGTKFDLAAACAQLNAEVIALQEVWTPRENVSSARTSADELGMSIRELPLSDRAQLHGFRIVDPPERPQGSWGLAVLTSLPVHEVEVIDLGQANGDPIFRRAMALLVQTRSGCTFWFVNAHLTHRVLQAPGQLRTLAAWCRAARWPAVVSGDLNQIGIVASAVSGLRRAVRGPTWPARLPVAQLDHVLLPAGVDSTDGTVVTDLGSDHHAVRVELSFSDTRSGSPE